MRLFARVPPPPRISKNITARIPLSSGAAWIWNILIPPPQTPPPLPHCANNGICPASGLFCTPDGCPNKKGHEVFLQALAKLPPENAAVIAGSGRRQKRLAELARRLKVAERTRFIGARRDMREIYALSDVVLSCAIKPESFGRTIAEALAMQKPVIAANHGGARDIITAEECGGILIPPGDADALAAALQKPLPDASQSRARVAARFTAKKMAEETLAVYKKSFGGAARLNKCPQKTPAPKKTRPQNRVKQNAAAKKPPEESAICRWQNGKNTAIF